jgi:hypothetical protein
VRLERVEGEILRCLDYGLLLVSVDCSELCHLPPGPACQVPGQAVSHLAHISPVTGGWTDEAVQVVRSVLLCTEVWIFHRNFRNVREIC